MVGREPTLYGRKSLLFCWLEESDDLQGLLRRPTTPFSCSKPADRIDFVSFLSAFQKRKEDSLRVAPCLSIPKEILEFVDGPTGVCGLRAEYSFISFLVTKYLDRSMATFLSTVSLNKRFRDRKVDLKRPRYSRRLWNPRASKWPQEVRYGHQIVLYGRINASGNICVQRGWVDQKDDINHR